MPVPVPTPIYRLIHGANLGVLLDRRALHAPNNVPGDGRVYRSIHDPEVRARRAEVVLSCGPRGTAGDYVSFYFDPRSPMLLQLKTGHVAGFTEGQRALIHLVSTAQRVEQAGVRYVFSDGHGLARFTRWFDSLANLDQVDWDTVRAHFWADQPDDLDRQRRKQAEFLVHQSCGWEVLSEILVLDAGVKARVEAILSGYDEAVRRPVRVAAEAYY